ncbi:MAG TPA: hypothetical protein VIP29_05500 [Nitrososphaeraceae archaeon]
MVRVVSFKIVNLPQEKVFSVIKDIGKLPSLFPNKYKSFNILEQSDNYILTEEIVSISGKEIKQKVKHILEPNRLLKSEIIEWDTKGTVLMIELNPKSNSITEIKIDADLMIMSSFLFVFDNLISPFRESILMRNFYSCLFYLQDIVGEILTLRNRINIASAILYFSFI